ncbi:MAG: T9SS type A sorting domain-containing protein [Bacteroidales bacterium]|nr:T9SS type A sorting domain-containing protein [Bacteroidales bacterium]
MNFKNQILAIILFFISAMLFQIPVSAQTVPADPEMIKISKTLLHYFDTIYQKKIIGVMRGTKNASKTEELTGEYPAMVEEDLSGWHKTAWSSTYANTVQAHINTMTEVWEKENAIPGMSWHWGNPLTGGGDYPACKIDLTEEQFNNMVTEGTEEYRIMMEDLRKHADYLQQLTDRNIPLIWRPLHEIDGGWFWWTDKVNPENTVKLWKIMYNYLVKEREMHNLIWVYSAGIGNPAKKDMDYRRSYYPGDEWCDIVGIDLYGYDYRDTGIYEFWHGPQSYQEAFDVMQELAPDKMVVLSETDALPNMEKTFHDHPNFAKWLWAMPWWAFEDRNPEEWIEKTYTHENIVMQPDLPDFKALSTGSVNYKMKFDQLQFSLYPVPCSDMLYVKPEGKYDLLVYSVYGQLLGTEYAASAMNIADLKPGIYFLKIRAGHEMISGKFVKRK